MNTTDLNNPDQANDLPVEKRELIKQMQYEYKGFNEQQKLFDKLHGNHYVGYLHPELENVFLKTRGIANSDRLAEKQNGVYFKLMRIESLEGLTFHEMAMVFNFIEGLSVQEAIESGIDGNLFLDVFEQTYNESALNVWNKQVDVWKEEIAIEKQELVGKINAMVDELNKEHKKTSRKARKSAKL